MTEALSPQAEAAQAVVTSEMQGPQPDPKFVIEKIGPVPFTAHGNHYSGCKVMRFEDAEDADRNFLSAQDQVNAWFEKHQNILCVQMDTSQDGACITMVVTNTLSAEQLEVVNARAHIIEREVQDLIKSKQKHEEEAIKRVEDDEKKLRELAAVGEKCLNNHGGVIKQLREKETKKHGRLKG